MLDGPAILAAGARPACAAARSRAPRNGEPSGSAYGGHRVVSSMLVSEVPGQALSTRSAAAASSAAAEVSSSAGVSRTSTLIWHRSGTIEYPSPPLMAVTVSLAGKG